MEAVAPNFRPSFCQLRARGKEEARLDQAQHRHCLVGSRMLAGVHGNWCRCVQAAVEKRLLLVLQDLFAAGHDKIRVSPAATYLSQSRGKGHTMFNEVSFSPSIYGGASQTAHAALSRGRTICKFPSSMSGSPTSVQMTITSNRSGT